MTATTTLHDDLVALLGSERVSTGDDDRRLHGTDESWHPPAPPDAVVYPTSTADIVGVLAACARHGVPVIPYGAGSSLEGHVLAVHGGVCVDTRELNRILRVSVDDMDVTVQAGVRRRQLEAALRPEGVFFPVDPGADASIGGMVATGASGTTTVRYGSMRENVLSLEVVTAGGRVVRTRSRARKSSAGYDLTHLFIGSEGTLGVITEATLRLHPTPEAVSAAVCPFPTLAQAVDCVMTVLQHAVPVTRIELLDEVTMEAIRRRSGLAHAAVPTLFFEFDGTPDEVAERAAYVGELVGEHAGGPFHWATDETERRRLWDARHAVYDAVMALRPGARGMTTDVCVPISRLAECIRETRADLDASGLQAAITGHVGDGNFHTLMLIDPADDDEVARAVNVNTRMVRRALAMDGTCTGEHGVGLGKSRYLPLEHGQEGVELMRAIKRAFDPEGMLNPGKVLDG